MKKISLMMLAVLGMAFASCEDNKYPDPQSNPQLPMFTDGDVSVVAEVPQAIDLVALNADNTPIELGKVGEAINVPEGYEIYFVGQLGREADYKHAADFEITVNPETHVLTVAPDALEAAYVQAIGKSAKPKEVFIRAAAYAKRAATDDEGEAIVRIGNADKYYLNASSVVTPLDLGIVIEAGYGILGTINGWDVATAVPFQREDPTVDVYDNAIFTLVVNISAADAEGGWWWKIVPQSTIDEGTWVDAPNAQFGVAENGDDALEGNLIPKTETSEPGAGCVKTAGLYTLIIDMENQSYEFKPVYSSYLWTPGNANGWSQASSNVLFSTDDVNYCGLAIFDGEFKLTSAPDWNGTNYGSGAPGKLSTDGGNLSAPYGAYWCKVNVETLEYSITEIQSVGVIGTLTDWSSQINLFLMSDLVYCGEVTLDGGEFKFRFNDDWSFNLGGKPGLLVPDGGNLSGYAPGRYYIELDLTTLPYTCKIEPLGEQQD